MSIDKTPSKRTLVLSLAIIVTLLLASVFLAYEFHFKDNDKRTNAQKAIQSIVEINCTDDLLSSAGTGFIIEHNGKKIITNAHVVVYETQGMEYTYETIECKFYNSTQIYILNVVRCVH